MIDIEAIDNLSRQIKRVSEVITPIAAASHDATGGTVGSLTEAVMGITSALQNIADALHAVAGAIQEKS